ncbi:MAG: hypothetical protein BXU00_03160 [Candidatus Nanoclepta minutus]|uniref:Acetyl-CoA synthetase n=1 Tax=Candidatus Nanoclepta minutus TaxID=1940235 RepID=A0A397WLY2_9ARCH|nr:MAG: hypothetical protein BXU00_03160 [Candidatus Nanoclepta minutus]
MLKEGFELLQKYGIPIPEYWVNEIPKDPKFPLVIKADVLHKTDEKAIIKNINNFNELLESYNYLSRRFQDRDIIVQRQISGNYIEVIIGIREDPTFEKVFLIGLGGIYTELLRDYVILVPPFEMKEMEASLRRLKLSKVLFGYRGMKINLELLYDISKKLITLYENERLREIEINPLMINESNAFAVDVRLSTK